MINSFVYSSEHNNPISSSCMLNTTVIKPLCITPSISNDYINWPTIPVGSKYTLNTSLIQDADWKSIFRIMGEPGYPIEISISRQTELDNVELSFGVKGTDQQYLGNPPPLPSLVFDNVGIVVNLNSSGFYFIHFVYEWIWAKDNATPGEKHFSQQISVRYYGL
jgi:hypothetical protein